MPDFYQFSHQIPAIWTGVILVRARLDTELRQPGLLLRSLGAASQDRQGRNRHRNVARRQD